MTLEEALTALPEPRLPIRPLVPSFLDPAEWRPRARRAEPPGWRRLRAQVLERDGGCVYCGHQATGRPHDQLEVNHRYGYRDNRPEALETVCVLCHRVLHAGRSAAIYGSLLLFRHANVDQTTLIRLSWWLRQEHGMPDRPLMALLGLEEPMPFRMDRPYLATLAGYVVAQYWLLERP
jgi:hypothetical protein